MIRYALVLDGILVDVRPPSNQGEPKLLDGQIMRPPNGEWTVPLAAAVGFYPVVGVVRPPDTLTERYERSVTMVNGDPTETWTAVTKTQQEQDAEAAAAAEEANRLSVEQALGAAMGAMQNIIDNPPTNLAQAQTAIVLEARVLRRLIRLAVGDLDSDA